MFQVLNIVFPVFALGALGYSAVRWWGFPDKIGDSLQMYLFNIAVPFMMVRLISSADLPTEVPWGILGSYFGPMLLVYALICSLLWFLGGRKTVNNTAAIQENLGDYAIISQTTVFGNILLLGLPLVLRTLGEEATIVLFIVLSVHSLILVTLTLILIEIGLQHDTGLKKLPRSVLRSIGRNPVIIALLVGLLMNLFELRLPEPIDQVSEYFQGSVTPCALFAVGASLVRFRLTGNLLRPLLLSPIKLLLMPALVYMSASYIFELNRLWVLSLTLMAAMPTGIVPYILAGRYRVAYPYATTTVTLSHLLSVVTLSVLIYFIRV